MKTLVEIEQSLNAVEDLNLSTYNLTVLRNITIEPIESYFKYFLNELGFKLNLKFGEYDNIFSEAVEGNNDLINKDTDCIIIYSKLETLSPKLSYKFNSLSTDEIRGEIEFIQNYAYSIFKGLQAQTDAMILWHGFEISEYPSYGICDLQVENGQNQIINELNGIINSVILEFKNIYFVNTNICLSRVGSENFYDLRYWHIGKAPYSKKALKEIAFEGSKYIRAILGKNKKCLVLDCDNTLWGSVVGEEGLSGIKLSSNYPGSSFIEFQQEILELHKRGIILALCSKNNENDVWDVFEQHPDMVLKREHIATARINWHDKVENIKQIALDLNIGLDSLVFIDDSEFEVSLVRKELPEVEVIQLDSKQSINYKKILASCGLFDTLTISSEDKKRGAMYYADLNRKEIKSSATDMLSYLTTLEMKIYCKFASDFSIPRVSQQTLKTNQFNLTTKRYNESDIKKFTSSDNSDVITLQLTDKFGDSGIVGTCILKYKNNYALVDTLLISCRALGRGVEDVFLCQILRYAQKKGYSTIQGVYKKTKKNVQVELFYQNHGFTEIREIGRNDNEKVFNYDLGDGIVNDPDYFKEVNSEIG